MTRYVLALDQGTTSSRAMVFAADGRPTATSQREIRQILPSSGQVEHAPEEIWQTQLAVAKQALLDSPATIEQMAAIGITNQRETTLLWDAESGKPVSNAIVWQSRVSEPVCERLRNQGIGDLISERTGLLIDPYFSATKLVHLLESDPELRQRALRGELRFGTVDSFLIWRLTNGRSHVTDVSNASRTMLMNLQTLQWDAELLELLDIPASLLPAIKDSSGLLGECDERWFGRRIPITGCAGDQQAATFGQACFEPGMAKNTLGTGGFLLMNVGDKPKPSQHRLLSTVGWRIGGTTTYCLEGGVFIAGALIQWLRDQVGLLESAASIEALANRVEHSDGVVIVPAFVGLGAPHWDPHARGAIFGINRSTTDAHLARAALEALALQNIDLVRAMEADAGIRISEIKYDGGASVNDLLMQIQADLLNLPLQRPQVAETTALGAAYLAGLEVGVWEDLEAIKRCWVLDQAYHPQMKQQTRDRLTTRWNKAVQRSLGWELN